MSVSTASNMPTAKHTFTRTEWLLIIAVIMMIEYWLITVSYSFKDSETLISYVSFAATIASILLAVIAIIYSFVQADAQQASSAMIVAQIDSLRSVAGKLAESGDEITDQVAKMTATATKLELLEGSLDSAHQKLQGIEGHLTGIQGSQAAVFNAVQALGQKTEKPNTQNPQNLNDPSSLSYRLYQASAYEADIFGYFLSTYLNIQKSTNISLTSAVSKLYIDPLVTSSQQTSINETAQTALAKGFMLMSVSRGLGILSMDKKEWKINKDFVDGIHAAAEITRNNTDVPLIFAAIKLIDEAALKIPKTHSL